MSLIMDVSIILVNYKTSKLTAEAIDSIIEKSTGFSYEIIVVDNTNDEKEYTLLAESLKGKATVIDAKANLGFGKANNLGAESATGKYLYFINTDTKLINNAIYELYSFLEGNMDAGMAGSNLFNLDGTPNHSYMPFEKNYHNDRKTMTFLFSLRNKLKKNRIDFNFKDKPKQINGYLCGASMMVRKDLFDKIGGFEKDIFMYGEDSLICFKVINEYHTKLYNVPSSKIIHFDGGRNDVSDVRAKMYVDGNYIYYQKAFGEKIALKYLKMVIRKYRQKDFIARHFHIGINANNKIYTKAFENKIKELEN